ncbi:HoxN/HupN/NixA family nickel/cobalt transporter [Bradyrhizobium sp.]|uniref:HoxN/HupN/NixA family nickel/cobalt transporter n=1 Tax=Bradyrhizobium sp. TaxID=376 RepID=UPI00262419D8|nr:HoxN/HupN/NixA family nickel/cobalt transporter [Bradyrhizobium sp.]
MSLAELFDDKPAALNAKTAVLYAVLVSANVLAWLWAFLEFRDQPILLGTASLAYAFGLRHAVDPDHIAAIDNVTRKLMQEGKRPVSAGFFFALRHSTVVVIASLLIALSVGALEGNLAWLKGIGGVIGTGVSASFLFIIALINALILVSVYRAFTALRRGERVTEEALHDLLSRRGLLSRGLRAVFRVMTRSWHMYPLGFLFGLGFDTASEVGLLGISAAQGSAGLAAWSLLIFPALFTAGMTLVDTTDGVLMVQTYGWAFIKPVRKLYYNLTMTLISIIVALLIGGLEVLGLLASRLGLEGRFWNLIDQVNESFGVLGYLIVGVFAACWVISVLIYKIQNLDQIEEGLSPGGDCRIGD